MNRPKGNFSKKQQARAMEHVSVKPNERRKKLSLLQMQRGEVIKYMQIWQGSQKCKDVPFVLILFLSVLILFSFARCHICWCMQTCNVYMDSTIIFYFLFCHDSSITWRRGGGSVRGARGGWRRGRTDQTMEHVVEGRSHGEGRPHGEVILRRPCGDRWCSHRCIHR